MTKLKILLINFIIFASLSESYCQMMAQKVGVVDLEYILNAVPQYADAQQQLEQAYRDYQMEIDKANEEVATLEKTFKEERILLTSEMILERQDEINQRRTLAKELANKYFGTEGEFIKQRRLLVRPVQDLVHGAIREVAEKAKLNIVLDKSNEAVLYFDKFSDISEQVVTRLKSK